MTLLVLASEHDWPARSLVRRWEGYGARLLTCRDLSTRGWRYHPGDPAASRAVVGGRVVPLEEVAGVLVRLASVTENELPHIVAADRAYVAAEMTAFLVAWLTEATVPVVNRPTPLCLMGPNWHHEQWLDAAARAGARLPNLSVPARPPDAIASGADSGKLCTLTVVGESCLGEADESLKALSRRIAGAAGATLLDLQFSRPDAGAEFAGAYLGADVSRPAVADALLDCFRLRAVAAC
jgi:hypothetical protein